MLTLSEFLLQSRIKQRDFAAMIGVDQSVVSRLVRGVVRPSLKLAFQIEGATGGSVPARSWVLFENAPDCSAVQQNEVSNGAA